MPGRVFIDTNILIYASLEFPDEAIKRERSKTLLRSSQSEIVLSAQAINES